MHRLTVSFVSFIISICIFLCIENLITRCEEDTNIHFANAWMATPTHHFSSRFTQSTIETDKHNRQSKVRRWYVHDDDTVATQTASDSTILSPPTIQYNKQNEQSHINYNSIPKLDLKILLIDNHDSYTYNLYQYISTMSKHPVDVVMNDAYDSVDSFLSSLNNFTTTTTTITLDEHYDCIILSPGPGQPSHPSDMGIVLDVIRDHSHVPILGVCLGHQALGYVYGKEVTLSPCGPVHGLMSSVSFDESYDDDSVGDDVEDGLKCQLFNNLPQDFDVVRYHSLVVDFPPDGDDVVESEIEPIAWCNSLKESTDSSVHSNDGTSICMALRHKHYPHYGVQFHPESIGTGNAGYQILHNFCNFAHEYKNRRGKHQQQDKGAILNEKYLKDDSLEVHDNQSSTPSKASTNRVLIHKIDKADKNELPLPKQVFETMYSSRPNSFWLDSSTADESNVNGEGCPITENSRFSIMGSNDGPMSKKIEYFGREHDSSRRGLRITSSKGEEEKVNLDDVDILSYLRQQLVNEGEFVDAADLVTFDNEVDSGYTLNTVNEFGQQSTGDVSIPFDYRGGYVGYLGYEVRHDTQCWIFEQEGGYGCDTSGYERTTTNPNIPTAAFLFVDQSLVYDHETNDWYIIGVGKKDDTEDDTISWMHDMKTRLEFMKKTQVEDIAKSTPGDNSVAFVPNRSKTQYQKDIARSHEEIRNGESYELCVTNQLEAELKLPKQPSTKASHEAPFELYKRLRQKNPAPFSAFMNFYDDGNEPKEGTTGAVSICCSSPERFLSVKKASLSKINGDRQTSPPTSRRQFVVESKPIKGTAARYIGDNSATESPEVVERIDSQIAEDLKESVKDRAENLMIVDLLRNDLGRVCQVGSVHVPKLMHIESYATVHQMVSTVRGILDGDATHAIDVIEACFPGGSMTGAPKQRTMEILDEIERGVSRGPYSGCLGYISLNGCMDMNIIIRSAVLTPSSSSREEDNADVDMWKASIGCGGAITALSDSEDEYEEMLLKSRIVRSTISEWVSEANM